ncbi:MAG: STAS domain-containing protein [Chitinivibrionales bacterium]|nr:STAS domain-containing protein [Chitinivibrionales bacterium]MBD3358956.1 STAS domain-containing protein [Chitinivibrionales bacterium]
MELTHVPSRGFDTFFLKGNLIISSLLPLTTTLSKHVQEHPGKDLALDMSGVNTVDSSGLRLLVNLKKRLQSQHGGLYLVGPSQAVKKLLDETNLASLLTTVDSSEQIERKKATDVFEACRVFTVEQDGWLTIRCSCPICGSSNVSAYLIDVGAYRWRWVGRDPFPTAYHPETDQPVEVFGHLPLVCQDCYMASIDVSDFNVLDDTRVARKSIMEDMAKSLLAKTMKKRKKMMDIGLAIGDKFFEYPRNETACYQAYLLASNCSRAQAMDRNRARPFTVGYLNYLALRFAKGEAEDEHLDNCRTWLNQALTDTHSLSPFETAVAHFAMFTVALKLDRKREASQIYAKFEDYFQNQSSGETAENVTDPRFWFIRTQKIWHEEIEQKSRALRLN